jgi:hypothetical protein
VTGAAGGEVSAAGGEVSAAGGEVSAAGGDRCPGSPSRLQDGSRS